MWGLFIPGNPSAGRCQAHVNLVEMQQMTAEVGSHVRDLRNSYKNMGNTVFFL